jgi:hypothetical protein
VAAFGGFNNADYGWELQYISGNPNTHKTLFFDNQSASGFNRSIDFRIDSVNKLSIENNGTLLVGSGANPSYRIDCNTFSGGGILNLDLFDIYGRTTNHHTFMQIQGNGAATNSGYGALNFSTKASVEMSIVGTTAYFTTYKGLFGTAAPDTIIIGDSLGIGGIGTADGLNTIQFNFRNTEEMRIERDLITFNNGAVDTQIDWGTSGELGLQVATNDIIRLTATQIQAIQDIVISDAQNIIVNTTTGTKIATATSQKIGFFNATPVTQRQKANYNNWAALSDVVNALVDLGLFDQV